MSEKPTSPLSMRKAGSTTPAAGSTGKPSPPRFVVLAAGALVLSGLAAVGAALSLFGLKGWLRDSLIKSINDTQRNAKPKDRKSAADLHAKLADVPHQVDLTTKSQLIATAVVLVALTVVALAAYKGRYWARWGVVGLWVLSTFTGTLAGLVSVISIASNQPIGFKLPAFISGVLFVAAVVLTNLRPSVEYFNLSKPVRPNRPGGAQRRSMFAPREPASAGRAGTARAGSARAGSARVGSTRAASAGAEANGSSAPERSRSKQRANADAVAKGAELARTRAKASKSRRTGV